MVKTRGKKSNNGEGSCDFFPFVADTMVQQQPKPTTRAIILELLEDLVVTESPAPVGQRFAMRAFSANGSYLVDGAINPQVSQTIANGIRDAAGVGGTINNLSVFSSLDGQYLSVYFWM